MQLLDRQNWKVLDKTLPCVLECAFSTCIGRHFEYVRRCSAYREDIIIHVGGYHEYSRVFGTLEGVMSTSEDTTSTLRGVQ